MGTAVVSIKAYERNVASWLLCGVGLDRPECVEEYWTLGEAVEDSLSCWLEDDGPCAYMVVDRQGICLATIMRDQLHAPISHVLKCDGEATSYWTTYLYNELGLYNGVKVRQLTKDVDGEWVCMETGESMDDVFQADQLAIRHAEVARGEVVEVLDTIVPVVGQVSDGGQVHVPRGWDSTATPE